MNTAARNAWFPFAFAAISPALFVGLRFATLFVQHKIGLDDRGGYRTWWPSADALALSSVLFFVCLFVGFLAKRHPNRAPLYVTAWIAGPYIAIMLIAMVAGRAEPLTFLRNLLRFGLDLVFHIGLVSVLGWHLANRVCSTDKDG
ncbi:MAG: hypothetical protein H3C58_07300 [Fimbriimonadaceae bacterium]|nr:hypothetical protein [Fimbriimonadaceae bacterium]